MWIGLQKPKTIALGWVCGVSYGRRKVRAFSDVGESRSNERETEELNLCNSGPRTGGNIYADVTCYYLQHTLNI